MILANILPYLHRFSHYGFSCWRIRAICSRVDILRKLRTYSPNKGSHMIFQLSTNQEPHFFPRGHHEPQPTTHHDVLIVVQGPVVFLFFHVDFSSTWHESRPSCSCLCQPKQKGYDRANRTEDGATDCSRSIMMHMILFW